MKKQRRTINGSGSKLKPPEKIPIQWVHAKESRLVPYHGVFGGLIPRGDLHVSIYAEQMPDPEPGQNFLQQIEGQTGRYKEENKPRKASPIIREVQVRFVIPRSLVRDVADWFAQKANEIDQFPSTPV